MLLILWLHVFLLMISEDKAFEKGLMDIQLLVGVYPILLGEDLSRGFFFNRMRMGLIIYL